MTDLNVNLPTCRVWRGNLLPPQHRHSGDPAARFLAPRPVEFGWISACDICEWTRRDPPDVDPDVIEQRRVDHLTTAHAGDLVLGQATIHLNRKANA